MKKSVLILQFVLTLFILAFIPDNLAKVALLLPLWWVTFGGLNRRELIAFGIINLIFIVSDIGAIQNEFFQFTKPDLFGLPYWEFFMWGFYLLHTHRLFPTKVEKTVDFKILVLAVVFSQLFAVIPDRDVLLAATGGVLVLTLILYPMKENFIYCFYLMAMGVATEFIGLRYSLWTYPERDYNSALLQFVIMWGAAGIYFRHIMGRWLAPSEKPLKLYKDRHEELPVAFQSLFQQAQNEMVQNQWGEAAAHLEEIAVTARRQSLQLNYDFYILYSQLCTQDGNLRQAVELYREALPLATNPVERAYVHLQTCRIYRMMILMKNARSELNHAFQELNLDVPTASAVQAIKTTILFLFRELKRVEQVTEAMEKRRLEIAVALYEEAGLSAYYFLEYPMLLQCSLNSKHAALKLGPSIQLVNWLGGSSCVFAVLGWHSRSQKLMDETLKVAEEIKTSYATSKAQLWKALHLSYLGRTKESVALFQNLLVDEKTDLTVYDQRLVATTLSCHYLIRGHMHASNECIRHMNRNENPRSRYFSCGKAFVDWYRLPALGFLGEEKEAAQVLKNSQVVFNRIDEEKWQVTQFLGGLLGYYYTAKETDLESIEQCLHRFEVLNLEPRWTYVEGAQIWIFKAHLFIELARQGKISSKRAQLAVNQLKKARHNRDIEAHWQMAQAKLILLQNGNEVNASDYKRAAQAWAEAQDNYWVQFEVLRYELMKHKNSEKVSHFENQIKSFCEKHQWKGMSL